MMSIRMSQKLAYGKGLRKQRHSLSLLHQHVLEMLMSLPKKISTQTVCLEKLT